MNPGYARAMRLLFSNLLLSLLIVALSACAAQSNGGNELAASELNSGLEGLVTVGPQCPVVRVGESCPDAPYAATLELWQAGILRARFQSDAQGQFRVLVKPGSYLLEPKSPSGVGLPAAGSQTVTVLEGQFSSVAVVYDSGIR
jgi:hypothetical protein